MLPIRFSVGHLVTLVVVLDPNTQSAKDAFLRSLRSSGIPSLSALCYTRLGQPVPAPFSLAMHPISANFNRVVFEMAWGLLLVKRNDLAGGKREANAGPLKNFER